MLGSQSMHLFYSLQFLQCSYTSSQFAALTCNSFTNGLFMQQHSSWCSINSFVLDLKFVNVSMQLLHSRYQICSCISIIFVVIGTLCSRSQVRSCSNTAPGAIAIPHSRSQVLLHATLWCHSWLQQQICSSSHLSRYLCLSSVS